MAGVVAGGVAGGGGYETRAGGGHVGPRGHTIRRGATQATVIEHCVGGGCLQPQVFLDFVHQLLDSKHIISGGLLCLAGHHSLRLFLHRSDRP